MPRYQEFNTQEALGKALQVFWSKGYKGASLSDLLDEMGIGKGSFYATFGSKRELFLSALKRYGEKQAMVCQAADILASRPARTAIAGFFEKVIDRAVDDKRCCMFGKTALEFWQSDREIADATSEGVKQVEKAFLQAVTRGQNDGDISAKHNPEAIAQFLTSTYYGLQVMASANPDRKALKNVVSTALVVLD
jgi:TetR/AcrR family transcriptional repressor of nem operon